MKSMEFLETILTTYTSTFDLHRPYQIGERTYPAYGYFFSHLEKYVLVREANLWSSDSFEHSLFQTYEGSITRKDINDLYEDIENYVEPMLVRKGEDIVPKNHMYSYITCILISDGSISKEVQKSIRSFKFEKGYLFNIRGYSQGRMLAVDLENQKIYANFHGRKLKKHYKNLLKDFFNSVHN